MKIFNLLLCTVLFFSCSKKKEKDNESSLKHDKNKTYSYVTDSTKVTWIAYKFTEKVGVHGSFDSLKVFGVQEKASSIQDLFRSASFSILVSSINSGDTERDKKLIKYFFHKLKDTEKITGHVTKFNDDNTGEMMIKLNQREQKVPFTLTENGTSLILKSEINLEKFLAQNAMQQLNNACKVLHIGKDGISKLWPDVAISLRVVLQ